MRLPTPFGKYLLLERISVGGMAEVFKAKAFGVEGFEKIIAIKKILPSMAEDADFIQMFIDEAKICGQLNHANICQIFELGRIDDSHFIAMEYIWGKDLLQIQNRFRRIRKNMTVQMAAFLASKMCEGLDYAHRKKDATGKPLNIIHRDVSPQNVIVSYEGEVKVIDFGIAKAASRSVKTQAGVLKGKFGYMSPEQVAGKNLDQRADIFAIGTILYELLTNERLFLGESDFATLEKVRNVAVPPPSQVNKEIPAALDAVIMKALAKDGDKRYQWASEMHDDLQDFLAQTEPVYNAKALSTWMRAQFVVEMRKEAAVLDEQRKIGKEAMNADKGPSKSTTPPSARLRSPTIAPSAGAPKSTAPAAPAAEVVDPELASELESGSLLDEVEPEEGGLLSEKTAIVSSEHEASALLNEKTSIVAPGQGPGDLPAQSTQILGGPPGDEKGPGDLAALSTVVFNPDGQHGAPAPPPVAQGAPGMQAADPFTSTLGPAAGYQDQQQQQQQQQMQLQIQQQQMQMQQMQMQMQMQQQAAQGMSVPNFQAYGSAGGMPVMAVPYGTGSMSAMPQGNHTGMMMLPNGTIVPFSGPMAQPAGPVKGSTLWKDILVGIAAAVAVVGLVLGLKFVLTPKKGTIVLTVTPQRPATVFMDGEERGHLEPGAAFLLKELTRGPHLLLVRTDDGAAQLTQTIEVTAGELTPVTLQLSASGASTTAAPSGETASGQGSGILRLRLPPDGALVSVNGRLINEKDIQKGYLVPAGVPQEVIVKKAGKRPVTFSETLKPGEEKERTVELKEGRGRLVISTRPAGVDIVVNGRSYGKSPVTVDDLDPTKAAKVIAKKRGVGSLIKLVSFGESFDQTLDLDFGTPSGGGGGGGGSHAEKASPPPASSPSPPPAAPPPAPGSDKEGFLIANSQPYAKVLVDGKDTGKVTPIAPRDHIPLKPGKHVITFVTSDKRVSADVIIKSGEEAKVVRNLTE